MPVFTFRLDDGTVLSRGELLSQEDARMHAIDLASECLEKLHRSGSPMVVDIDIVAEDGGTVETIHSVAEED